MFYKQYYIVGDTFKDSIVSMVAGVLGMIPEGLVLLTSVALTLGALVLANKKTLVQELYCICLLYTSIMKILIQNLKIF